MKKVFAIIIGVAVIVSGFFIGKNFLSKENEPNQEEKEGPKEEVKDEVQKYDTVEAKVDYLMENLTLEEKIGQMLMVYYSGSEVNDSLKKTLEANKPGGFILFSNNITTYDNTVKFVEDIKKTADIPMFISIDQEGGVVQRLTSLEDVKATKIPAMADLGRTNDTSLAYDVGKVIAEELRVFGVNMDFAPVVDVITENGSYIKNRSFGTDPQKVSDMGISLAKGLSDNSVIPVYKHFPGHGSTIEDSHYDLPTIKKSKEELMNSDLIPFKNAIASGAEVIMIGHLAIPSITGDVPASLSKELITGVLKEELNYQGLVVTDALNMGALTKNYTEQQIYEMAINAGVDILLMPKSSTSALDLIKKSIDNGTIKEEQIDNSVRKILTLKYQKLEDENRLDKSYLGSKEHQDVIAKIK